MRLKTHSLYLSILFGFPVTTLYGAAPTLQSFTTIKTIASTVPGNGDVNPYGVAIVPVTAGSLVAGDILVSNFNNSANLQGTGTTIVQISPSGSLTVFATITQNSLPTPCPGGIGLTTALAALQSGFVVVGSLPTTDGTSATAMAGCLIVLNSSGKPVLTVSGAPINGPWDMYAVDSGTTATLFVSNVLNGTVAANGNVVDQGSVARIVLQTPSGFTPQVLSSTVIAGAFPERTDPDALVLGPTGLALDSNGILYVADTLGNRIAAITHALTRTTDAGAGITVSHRGFLNMPLGLEIAHDGDILTVNAGDGNIVETTIGGVQTASEAIDVSNQGGGTLFGLAIGQPHMGLYYVDDGNNTLNLLH